MEISTGVVALLFTDLVGSTELLGRLGDDAAEKVRRAHFSLLREAVASFGGQEVKTLGDGLMVSFRSPVDAIGCAVAMQQSTEASNRREPGPDLAIRIGLHAGEPHQEAGDFHGTAVVVASRLCNAAGGGEILAGEVVAELVGSRGGFRFRSVGPLNLKGIDRPVPAVSVDWRAGGPAEPAAAATSQPAPSNRPSTVPRPRGPELVGRDGVLAELEAELDRAAGGELRCVLLLGDAGVGKTRLTAELVAHHTGRVTALSARAYPLGATASLGLWVEALERHLRQLPAHEIRRLCGAHLDDLAALFGSLTALAGGRPGPEPSRVRILEGLVTLLEGLAGTGPLVIVLDDVHLADGSSWEAVAFLARSLAASPILMVLAARPVELADQAVAGDVLHALDQEGFLRRLPVHPLDAADVRRLAGAIVGRAAPEALAGWLMERTRGNPLFVLGLVRALVEEDADLDAPVLRRLPEGLAERVTSRVAGLGHAELGLLELLAVAGRPVEFEELVTLSGHDGGDLARLLPGLVRSRFLAEEERDGGLAYGMAHPLVQEALYQATGGARRRELHRTVGRLLRAEGRLGEAASHFARAARPGDPDAISVLLEAVRQAEERQAFRESLALLRSLVQLLPSGDDRWLEVVDAIRWESNWVIDQPAELDVALGIAALREMDSILRRRRDPERAATVKFRLAASISWGEGAHAEARRLYGEAEELFQATGNRRGALLSANEMAFVAGMAGDFRAMEAGANAILAAAEAAGDDAVVRRALATIAWSAFFRGRFALAEASYRRAASFDSPEVTTTAFRLTLTLSGLAISLAFEGRMAEARVLLEEAKAQNPAHRSTPLSEWETRIHWLAGDFRSALTKARESLGESRRVVSPRTAMGLPFAALAAAELGEQQEADRFLAIARDAPGGAFFIYEHYCESARALLADRRGDPAACVAGLVPVVEKLLGMDALPFAALVLGELAEAASRCGDREAAARAAAQLTEVGGQIDRPLYHALAATGTAWRHWSDGAGGSGRDAARPAVGILDGLGYRALAARAWEILGRCLALENDKDAGDALARAAALFEACGATSRGARVTSVL